MSLFELYSRFSISHSALEPEDDTSNWRNFAWLPLTSVPNTRCLYLHFIPNIRCLASLFIPSSKASLGSIAVYFVPPFRLCFICSFSVLFLRPCGSLCVIYMRILFPDRRVVASTPRNGCRRACCQNRASPSHQTTEAKRTGVILKRSRDHKNCRCLHGTPDPNLPFHCPNKHTLCEAVLPPLSRLAPPGSRCVSSRSDKITCS